MRQPTDVSLVQNYSLARRLHELGLMPTIISKYVPGTASLVRTFNDANPDVSFSRGYSKTWARSNRGFKLSNILFRMYGLVSGDPTLKKGINICYLASAWEVAVYQYPELLEDKICDISRFAYMLQKVASNEYLVYSCCSSNCNNKFVIHENCERTHCWACEENKLLKSKKASDSLELADANASRRLHHFSQQNHQDVYSDTEMVSNLFLLLCKPKQEEYIPADSLSEPLRLVSSR
ncbi:MULTISPECIES: hypothetical protein [unclassified Shewanella]|uniref:hypothetical protein n=1 Tax=Shewanella TaxID=22 RepID=UPI0021DACB74|nr:MULTISPECIES: hypothetical protein [unclassified Shewanella]MCU7962054.1 hypothetical protein [Shewanella sp. SW32]MCU7969986.1 hypothetical protein [Shewanella sp. SW29]MCU8013839.1 hypothetical protein [Shewanella sp. SM74]MCU8056222.1 hypothetical protein [Shewanella sp. SM35]MCU8065156.1 hypothetical protein [Shewanella sp. SM34]